MELNVNGQSNVATRIRNYDDDTNTLVQYGKLVKQSSMNSFFNVNDFIETTTVPDHPPDNETEATSSALLIFKCFVIVFIILAAIFGNMLVIVSVMQHRKLRYVEWSLFI